MVPTPRSCARSSSGASPTGWPWTYKAPLDKYEEVTGAPGMAARVSESLGLVAHAGMDYEIRLTLHPLLHTHEDIAVMAGELAECGVRSVALQTFKPWNVLDPRLCEAAPTAHRSCARLPGSSWEARWSGDRRPGSGRAARTPARRDARWRKARRRRGAACYASDPSTITRTIPWTTRA